MTGEARLRSVRPRAPASILSLPSSMSSRHRHWERILAKGYPSRFLGSVRCDQLIDELRRMGLPVRLDMSAQDDLVAYDTKLTLQQPYEPLYIRLQSALQEENATLTFMNNQLLIISLDVSSDPDYFLHLTYDLSGLNIETLQLLDGITESVTPDDWYDTNGDAVMKPMSVNGRRLLTLAHSYAGHRQVQDYLRGLKEVSRNSICREF